MSLASYRRAREDFFDRYGHRWPATLADAFDILEVYPLSRAEVEEIRKAASSLAELYAKVLKLLACATDEALGHLGLPSHLKNLVRSPVDDALPCVLGRFDLARTTEGYKMLEFNADAPGLVVEAFSVNRMVCQAAGKTDPNAGCEELLARALCAATKAAVAHLERAKGGKIEGSKINVVVSARRHSARDQAIASYLRDLLQPFSAVSVPVEQITIDQSGFFTPTGERIDVLVRCFPLNGIHNDLFQQWNQAKQQSVDLLSSLIESRRVLVVNPPAAFLFSSKALQALIWGLFETNMYFVEKEREVIRKYMLPVYLDPPEDGKAYAVKPIYGSEGDSVVLLNSSKQVISASLDSTYSDQPAIYQKYVDLPREELMTEYGPRKLHLVTSCFVAGGVPSAICIRAGELVTNELAWILPVCIGE